MYNEINTFNHKNDFQGQNYNIPVSVWILDSHPYHAPVCFVKPTADMQIKVWYFSINKTT